MLLQLPPLRLPLQVRQFMDRHILPSEHVLEAHSAEPSTKWTIHPLMEELKVGFVLCDFVLQPTVGAYVVVQG
jgi:hypothetical protein